MVEECKNGKPQVRRRKSGFETQREALREVRWQAGNWEKQRWKMRLPFAGRVISEECYTFMSNDLTRLHLKSREKAGSRCLDLLLLQFLFQMSTLTSNGVQEKHIHREMLNMQPPHDPCWHSRISMFCFNPALAWSCGQDTGPMFSSAPEEHLPVLLHLKGIQLMFPKIPQQSEPQGMYSKRTLLNWTNTVTETHLKLNQRNPGTSRGIHVAETKAGHTSHSRPEQHCFPPLLDWSKCCAATSTTGVTAFSV